jgi:hypothetical protein
MLLPLLLISVLFRSMVYPPLNVLSFARSLSRLYYATHCSSLGWLHPYHYGRLTRRQRIFEVSIDGNDSQIAICTI